MVLKLSEMFDGISVVIYLKFKHDYINGNWAIYCKYICRWPKLGSRRISGIFGLARTLRIPLTFFYWNFNLIAILFCASPNFNKSMPRSLCTWQDSCAVVACAKNTNDINTTSADWKRRQEIQVVGIYFLWNIMPLRGWNDNRPALNSLNRPLFHCWAESQSDWLRRVLLKSDILQGRQHRQWNSVDETACAEASGGAAKSQPQERPQL